MKECDVCGNVFEKTRNNKKYCSVSCRRKIANERNKVWRLANPERVRAYSRKSYNKWYKTRGKAYYREYYKKNKEKYRESSKRYRSNPSVMERRQERSRQYYAKNRERILKQNREKASRNPGKLAAYKREWYMKNKKKKEESL